MRFDIYGRYQLEVLRTENRWEIYRHDFGKRRRLADFVIPETLGPADIAVFLDDMLHEEAGPGDVIRRID